MNAHEDSGLCPICGSELGVGYGFAGGGGIGPYDFCQECDLVVSKHVEEPGQCLGEVEEQG